MAIAMLAACQRNEVEDRLFAMAREEAAMPDCDSITLDSAWQQPAGEMFVMRADFVGGRDCIERWAQALETPSFRIFGSHGGVVPVGKYWPIIVGPVAGKHVGLAWKLTKPVEWLPVRDAK